MKDKSSKRKLRRLIGITLLVLLLAGGWVVAKVVWLKPFTINQLYDRALLKYAFLDPEMMSTVGLLDKVGLDFYNNDLTDPSFKAVNKRLDLVEYELNILRSFSRQEQTKEQLLSTDILDWYLTNTLESRQFLMNGYPVNQFLGVQKALPKFMCNTHIILSKGDATDYVTRLNQFGSYFDELIETLKAREQYGVIPPKFMVSATIADMESFINRPVKSHILYINLKNKVEALQLSEKEQQKLLEETISAIEKSVYPAYQKLITYYKELLNKATEYVGVWHQTNGDAFYSYLIKSSTTLDISPEDLYQMLEKEVTKLQSELKEVQGEGNDSSTGKAGTIGSLAECQKIVDAMYKDLDKLVTVKPWTKVVVNFSVTDGASDASICQYFPSDINGTVPAVISIPKSFLNYDYYTAKWILYHEGVPGHHLQLSIARELTNVPTFRKIVPFAAFSEGWATYAQDLPYTLGLTEDRNWREGLIRNRLYHMGRAMLDIGINYKRWTREEAVAFATKNHISDTRGANGLVDYCTVYPSIELSYAVGYLKIEELRDYAMTKLGDKFDLREFHDQVLKNGSIPLDILDQVIKAYVTEKLSQKSGN